MRLCMLKYDGINKYTRVGDKKKPSRGIFKSTDSCRLYKNNKMHIEKPINPKRLFNLVLCKIIFYERNIEE